MPFAPRLPFAAQTQFSHARPGTRSKSAKLLVNLLDAGRIEDDPISQATLPYVLPYVLPLGFHGNFTAV